MYLEKLIEEPRHIEIQVIGDQYGNGSHLSERDCSIQRRHQKLVEEAPSPFMTDKLRKAMGLAAIKAVKSIKYEGVGTVEFLVDKNRNFYFEETKEAELLFKNISPKKIEDYLKENKDALMSVGSYRIEDNCKYNFLEVLKGDHETIIGFPLKNLKNKFMEDMK